MSILSMLGNPWNPMPGWLHPGLADDTDAPLLLPYNRGAFDAVGLPYALEGFVGSVRTIETGSHQVFRRRLDTYSGFGGVYAYAWGLLISAFGYELGTEAWIHFLRNFFVHDRNQVHPEIANFWSPSAQSYVWYQSLRWDLVCNANIPPGLDNPEPPEIDPPYKDFGGWPIVGDSSKRWSLFPRTAPSYSYPEGIAQPYTLYQTYKDAVPFEFGTADTFRAGVFPFPFLQLHCMSRDDFGAIIRLEPVNP